VQIRIINLVSVAVLLLLPNSAHAQWFSNAALNAIQLDVRGTAIRNEVRNQNERTGVNNTKLIAKSSNTNRLSYRYSSAIRSRNLVRFIANTRKVDPVTAKNLEQFLASNDILSPIQKSMTANGLNANNLADAYAVYWTIAWFGAQGGSEDLPEAQMIAVRNQAAYLLQATKQFDRATDAQKQEIAEIMLLQSVLIVASVNGAKSDSEQLDRVKTTISQGAKRMGLDFALMNLTPQGFYLIDRS
jgi:hypothetical protein